MTALAWNPQGSRGGDWQRHTCSWVAEQAIQCGKHGQESSGWQGIVFAGGTVGRLCIPTRNDRKMMTNYVMDIFHVRWILQGYEYWGEGSVTSDMRVLCIWVYDYCITRLVHRLVFGRESVWGTGLEVCACLGMTNVFSQWATWPHPEDRKRSSSWNSVSFLCTRLSKLRNLVVLSKSNMPSWEPLELNSH